MERPPGLRFCLYDSARLDAVVDSMAARAATLLAGASPLVVVGVLRRGAPLADRLVERMVRTNRISQPLRLDLHVKRYADDLRLLHPHTELREGAREAAIDLSGHTVLVVDDVLYSGHSIARVVAHLVSRGAVAVRVAVLVDRGVAALPVHADICGLRLEVAPGDVVECNVPPFEPDWCIELLRPDRRPDHAVS